MVHISGKKYGRLTVIRATSERAHGQVVWECKCDCGETSHVPGRDLRDGHTKSCGCFQIESRVASNTRHGHASRRQMAPEYRVWIQMRQRCTNPNDIGYALYGGRGIAVCERWNTYENFLADMGERPGKGFSIERRDNAKGYCPENCYWATKQQQARNKRTNVRVTVGGVTLTAVEWAEKTGMKADIIRARIRRGVPPELAIKP